MFNLKDTHVQNPVTLKMGFKVSSINPEEGKNQRIEPGRLGLTESFQIQLYNVSPLLTVSARLSCLSKNKFSDPKIPENI